MARVAEAQSYLSSIEDQSEELLCIYFPERDKYQAARSRTREPVDCLLVMKTYQTADAFLEALGKRGATVKPMTRGDMIELCRERDMQCLMVMENPDRIKYEYVLSPRTDD